MLIGGGVSDGNIIYWGVACHLVHRGQISAKIGKLVVEGICLIVVVCDWFIIYSQDGNAN